LETARLFYYCFKEKSEREKEEERRRANRTGAAERLAREKTEKHRGGERERAFSYSSSSLVVAASLFKKRKQQNARKNNTILTHLDDAPERARDGFYRRTDAGFPSRGGGGGGGGRRSGRSGGGAIFFRRRDKQRSRVMVMKMMKKLPRGGGGRGGRGSPATTTTTTPALSRVVRRRRERRPARRRRRRRHQVPQVLGRWHSSKFIILYFEVCEVERGATTAKKCYANPQFESDIFAARTKRLKKRSAHFFSILNSRDEKTATSRHCETDTSQQQEEGIFKTRESSPCFLSLSLIPSLVRRHTHIRTHTKKRAR